MKRFAFFCALLFVLFAAIPQISLAEAPDVILSDMEGLISRQDLLDEIQQNLSYVESIGYTPANVNFAALLSQIAGMADGQPGQVYQAEERITLSGGVHYIAEDCDLESVTLLNNAVLFNFGGAIRSLSLKDDSKYFGTGKSAAVNIIMERHGVAYLQNTTGERLTAAGNSEAFLFDAANYPVLYALEEANVAVVGNNVDVDRGYVGKDANLFDPNGRVTEIEWEEGRNQTDGGRGSGGGGKKQEVGPYPPNIMEWVFGSIPQGEAVIASPTCECGCKCGESCLTGIPFVRCCDKCKCIVIY